MEKKRPIGVTLLAILAGFAAAVAIIYTLQMLHLWPVTGPLGLPGRVGFLYWNRPR